MRNGVILVDKPAGITSAGVVARVKRALKASKVGHAGTLDPDATGLLVVLVNGATKVASYAADGDKVYSGVIRLGIRTSTDDLSGEVLEACETVPAFESVQQEAARLVGELQQVPPKVSAVKVGGKRAHRLQRGGQDFSLPSRTVLVRQFDVSPKSGNEVWYRVQCGPGTYVRSLARDLGEALGCGGATASIRRERSGALSVDSALSLEQVSWAGVRDWACLLPEVARVEFPADLAAAIHNGQRTALRAAEKMGLYGSATSRPGILLYASEGEAQTLGILALRDDGRLDFELNLGVSLG